MSKHHICLNKEEYIRPVPVGLIGDNPTDFMKEMEDVRTLCGRKRMRILTLHISTVAFYIEKGMGRAICLKCLEHPDVALHVLSDL